MQTINLNEWLRYGFAGAISFLPWKVTKRELDQNIKRWQWSDNQNSKYNSLGEWAAQINFLYCLVWSLITGIIIGWYFGIPISNQHIYLLGSILSLIAAIIHHLRYIVFEKEITERIENKAI